jgi:hypothetical protein
MRVLRLISELRSIVSSIAGSMKSLGWTLVLLLLMIYVVGVYFTQSISEFLVDRAKDTNEPKSFDVIELEKYFGTLARTILTLYQVIVGGIDWDSLASPMIAEIGWLQGFALACYIAFALLALMNVVTGVFVQTALQSAKNEEDEFLTEQVIGIFRATDIDHDLSLSLEEVQDALNNPASARFFSSIDMSPEDAVELFSILDIDDSGEVCFEEFLQGCLRLNGPAKSKDMLEVMQAQRRAKIMVTKHQELIEEHLLDEDSRLEHMQDAIRKLTVEIEALVEFSEEEQRTTRALRKGLQEIERDQRTIANGMRVVMSLGDILGSPAVEPMDPRGIPEANDPSPQSRRPRADTGELV